MRGAQEAPRRPLRLFARPERASLLQSVPGALHLKWRGAQRAVARAEGPERIAMDWWRHQDPPPARDYYRIEDGDGRRLWLTRDTQTAQWSVQGVFA